MNRGRFLRSKGLRNLLWYAADGKCQRCGNDLPEHWHADHVVPFVVSGRTNVHEMQALCPTCNLGKGDGMALEGLKPYRFRKHQKQFAEFCDEIRGGHPAEQIFVAVTPAGGKSTLPVIAAAKLIRPGIASKLLWVVPRKSLMEQAEKDFLDPRLRSYLDHQHEIRSCLDGNEYDPSRGLSGYAITYQAIVMDSAGVNIHEFERYSYILVLDEVHHVVEGGLWHASLKPLIARARLVISMSGSLSRAEGNRIATARYKSGVGSDVIDLESSDQVLVVRYSRQDALRERAIIPVHFTHMDARAEWIDRGGMPQSIRSFDEDRGSSGDALDTVLRTEFALDLISRCLEHWNGHRANANSGAKMLVVAPAQEVARKYVEFLKSHGCRVALAISDESKEALRAIKAFKSNKPTAPNILVTVGMAYEGLSVPEITHIACLTRYRTYGWIEQMIARATRFNPAAGEWESQVAFVFVPDDPQMRLILGKIEAEQIEVVGRLGIDGGREGGPAPPPPGWDDIIPQASSLMRERASDLSSGEKLGFEETAQIKAAMERNGVFGYSPLQIKRVIVEVGLVKPADEFAEPSINAPLMTATEREANLRDSIQKRASKVDRANGWEYGETNRLIIRQFGKSREVMTLPELGQVWAWIQQHYPVGNEGAAS